MDNKTLPPTSSAVSLQELVTQMLSSSLPAATHNNTHVANEVTRNIALDNDNFKAAGIIGNILKTVIGNSRNGDIHIRADRYQDVVVVEVQERNNYNGYALAYSIGSIEPDAAMVGGHISMKGERQKIATISFSFPTSPIAA